MKVIIYLALFLPLLIQAQNRILIENVTIHTGKGEVINKGLLGIESGKIIYLKNALTTTLNKSEWDTIINLNGHHLYPGFIAPNSTLGLTEVDAVRSTRDFNEVGVFNPHIRSLIAFNTDSRILETVRYNGVLINQATPRGDRISGKSAIMRLSGWNWEDAAIKEEDGLHINWPNTFSGGGWWAEPKAKTVNKTYHEQVEELKLFMKAAQSYYSSDKKQKIDQRYEALKHVFDGQQNTYFHASELKALLDVLEFIETFKIKKPVIVGGYDSPLIAKQLKDANIPVIVSRLHSLPDREDEPIDAVYTIPKKLMDAGVLFCLQNAGDMEAMHTRNLPFLAGTARAYGLKEEEALQTITYNTAKILGIEKEYGSIEIGKSATLFVSKGDALEIKTNKPSLIMIDGKLLPIPTHQDQLYNKYKDKYQSNR